MLETEEKVDLVVVKRNGKKVDFDGTKILLAIKKGFDNVNEQDEETGKFIYDEKEIYIEVIKTIEKEYTDKIKIEEIQDLIEQAMDKKGYKEVHDSFAEYRERRAKSREMFIDDKRMHKFLKTIEGLGCIRRRYKKRKC